MSLTLEVIALAAVHLAVAVPLLVASERDRVYYETQENQP